METFLSQSPAGRIPPPGSVPSPHSLSLSTASFYHAPFGPLSLPPSQRSYFRLPHTISFFLSQRPFVQHSCSHRRWALCELASVVFPPPYVHHNQLMHYPQLPNSLYMSYEKPFDRESVSPADVAAITHPNIIKGLKLATAWLSVTLHYDVLWNIPFLSAC